MYRIREEWGGGGGDFYVIDMHPRHYIIIGDTFSSTCVGSTFSWSVAGSCNDSLSVKSA